MKKQASLKDLRRMCDYYCEEKQLCSDGIITTRTHRDCWDCPLNGYDCDTTTTKDLDKMNDIVVKWCEEHPVQTRADVFFKQYPNAGVRYFDNGSVAVPNLCPLSIDAQNARCYDSSLSCDDCKKIYWLTEVEE